jgi:uncharacterized protein
VRPLADYWWGLSARPHHFPELLTAPGDLVEIVSENYLFKAGGPAHRQLDQLRGTKPIAMHGVALNIAGHEDLDRRYLDELRQLVDWVDPVLVSDHLCFTGTAGARTYDLLPAQLDDRSLERVAHRVDQVQEALGRRLSLENITYYCQPPNSQPVGTFLSELARRTGCGVLLDVNNLYVNAVNHGLDALEELARFPSAAITQFHVAGHIRREEAPLEDTHDRPVSAAVRALLRAAVDVHGRHPIVLERDDDAPFHQLQKELHAIVADMPE